MIVVTNVKWPFEIIQGHLFGAQWKANEGVIMLYDNDAFISKASEDIDTESSLGYIVAAV